MNLHLLCVLARIIHEIPCEFGELQCIILQFDFILDSKFIFLCVKLIIIHNHTQKQSKLKKIDQRTIQASLEFQKILTFNMRRTAKL